MLSNRDAREPRRLVGTHMQVRSEPRYMCFGGGVHVLLAFIQAMLRTISKESINH